jgi:hypothetical protein
LSDLQENWRRLVNSLPPLDEGTGPPDLEKIEEDTPKTKEESNVIMYKLTTEVYVYQHIGSDVWFGSNTLQDVSILGEMTLAQARTIVNAKRIRRKRK